MPEYKNQHYVPQHYLKGWAEDKKNQHLPHRGRTNPCQNFY